jgi:hypothetical protein
LIQSNKTGYNQLISDRIQIYKRILTLEEEINELNKIFEEYNDAVKMMKGFFEPKVDVYIDPDNPNVFTGYMIIKYPVAKDYKFTLGNVTDFDSQEDIDLKKLFQSKAKEILETEFPEYFM